MEDVIFEIPIYLRTSKEYENERLLYENKLKKDWGSEHAMGVKIEPIWWPPWEYNDIIGYFKVIVNSSLNQGGDINGIRVEKYFIKNQRIVRDPNNRKAIILLNDPWFHKKLSIQNIQRGNTKSTLLHIINALNQDLKVKNKSKRYYIDCKYYQNLVECLDIEKLCKMIEGTGADHA